MKPVCAAPALCRHASRPRRRLTRRLPRPAAAARLPLAAGLLLLSLLGCGPGDETPLPAPAVRFSFVVMGDSQPTDNDCSHPTTAPEFAAFPELVLAQSPDLVLHVGDLVDLGRQPDAFTRLARCYDSLLSQVPFFITMGNHELDWNLGVDNYRAFLAGQLYAQNPAVYPGPYFQDLAPRYNDDPTDYFKNVSLVPSGRTHKTYYAFRYQNAVFLSLEQPVSDAVNTPLSWLEARLKEARADPTVDHIFVYQHTPFYSTVKPETSRDEEALQPARRLYEPLFRRYGVTMVFSGHVHLFERFYVPHDGHRTRYAHTYRVPPDKGVTHISLGPAGAPFLPQQCYPMMFERQERSFGYVQARGCGHNFVRVVVDEEGLQVTVLGVKVDAKGPRTEVWDDFRVSKTR